jgi:hypothetical protein
LPANCRKPRPAQTAPRLAAIAWLTAAAASCPADASETPTADSAPVLPEPAELERQGAVIGEVFVYPENIFNLEDPEENRGLYRLANKLHIRTRPDVIRQQLLFESGDPYSERLLNESERILRSARYLYDASVRPIAYRDGLVDVAVTTRDVWTLNPGLSFTRHGGKNTAGVELEELNLLGTGTDLSIAQKSGVDRDSTLIEYKDRHVFDSWVSVQAGYANNSDGSVRALDIGHPFYALDTRWAAGVSLLDDEHIQPLYDLGEVVDEFRSHQKFASASWGWSRGLENGWARRWSIGATYDDNEFGGVSESTSVSLVPEDRKLVYPWLGFELVQDDFGRFSMTRSAAPKISTWVHALGRDSDMRTRHMGRTAAH